jgi:hypothetical protein
MKVNPQHQQCPEVTHLSSLTKQMRRLYGSSSYDYTSTTHLLNNLKTLKDKFPGKMVIPFESGKGIEIFGNHHNTNREPIGQVTDIQTEYVHRKPITITVNMELTPYGKEWVNRLPKQSLTQKIKSWFRTLVAYLTCTKRT